jgi:monothiol glutaredoxin
MTKISLPVTNPDAPAAQPTSGASKPRTRAEGGDVMSEISREIADNPVFLYMKGTAAQPMCGFSARVVQILDHLHVNFATCNILEDGEKREAIKVYSKWPTIPQLYVNGQFIGGCDIVTEMFQDGELHQLLGVK